MITSQVTISINDVKWPNITVIINRGGAQVRSLTFHYDVAASQTEPAVRDAVAAEIAAVIKQRRGH